MSENKLPDFGSIDELVEFFDNHDMGDYLDEMPEAHFDVDIQRRTFLIPIDGELLKKLSRLAKIEHTSTEALVRAWLAEKVAQAA